MPTTSVSSLAVSLHEARLRSITADDQSIEMALVKTVLLRLIDLCLNHGQTEETPTEIAREVVKSLAETEEYVSDLELHQLLTVSVGKAIAILSDDPF